MRLLHTSDWHLGRSLHRADLRAAQSAFLDHLVDVARAEKVDAVLVAGDVYDRAVPPVDAVELCEDALLRLHDTGARIVRVDDGGVTGPTFFEHVRRLRRPVLNNPKGQGMQEPSGLVRRSVVHPTPLWTWSLVWRKGEDNPAVRAVIDEFTRDVGDLGVDDEAAWLPAADPYRPKGSRT